MILTDKMLSYYNFLVKLKITRNDNMNVRYFIVFLWQIVLFIILKEDQIIQFFFLFFFRFSFTEEFRNALWVEDSCVRAPRNNN